MKHDHIAWFISKGYYSTRTPLFRKCYTKMPEENLVLNLVYSYVGMQFIASFFYKHWHEQENNVNRNEWEIIIISVVNALENRIAVQNATWIKCNSLTAQLPQVIVYSNNPVLLDKLPISARWSPCTREIKWKQQKSGMNEKRVYTFQQQQQQQKILKKSVQCTVKKSFSELFFFYPPVFICRCWKWHA